VYRHAGTLTGSSLLELGGGGDADAD
jgi:hypothetical protein